MNLDKILPYVEKPGRYTGGELNSNNKKFDQANVNFCLAFPDIYDIGMCNLGFKIIYHLLNDQEGVSCERVFSPWPDMEQKLRDNNFSLFSLENKRSLKDFDILGFSLGYELCYTNILQILDLSNIPFKREDRNDDYPVVFAGGPCCCNPEPLYDFVDVFLIGDGEESMIEILDIFKKFDDKKKIIKEIADNVEGCYVPGISKQVKARKLKDFNNAYFPTKQIVPSISVVHDRAVLEIMRGCPNGCKFCQAGMIYRPKRERKLDVLLKQAKELINNTGYEEIGLLSLSSADHSQIGEIASKFIDEFRDKRVAISLPSLRVGALPTEVTAKIADYKKTGLTFAPEAGTQRLRDVIGKNINIDALFETVKDAKRFGWKLVKLYFMIGLPTETDEDIDGICSMVLEIAKTINVNVSIANFVPKPHTHFQRIPMAKPEYLKNVHDKILAKIKHKRNVKVSFHSININFLEGVLSRGNRDLGKVLVKAYESGCKFDAWYDFFDIEKWKKAVRDCGYDVGYLQKGFCEKDELPWDNIGF
ncbi:radical SAM protein [bacterium]|nr:radical SAM protein [bacterium]